MDAIGVKKYRKCLAELQKAVKSRKQNITKDTYNLGKRMQIGNPHTSFGCGYSDGYNAAMNDVLIMLSQEIDVAESSWNKISVRPKFIVCLRNPNKHEIPIRVCYKEDIAKTICAEYSDCLIEDGYKIGYYEIKHECKSCQNGDMINNLCLIDNKPCYQNKKRIHEECNDYKKGEWCSQEIRSKR